MKKLTAILLLIIFSTLILIGCAVPEPTVILGATRPWATSTKYEKATYSLSKDLMETTDGALRPIKALATGTYTYEIKQIPDVDEAIFSSEFTITYNSEKENGVRANLTDKVKASVRFSSVSAYPIETKKEVILADAVDVTNDSYTLTIDYNAKKSTLLLHGKTTNLDMASGTYFDNDMIYLMVRALDGLAPSQSLQLKTAIMLECHIKNKFFTTPINVSVAKDTALKTLPASFDKFGLEADDKGGFKAPSMVANISLGTTPSGPAVTAYYSTKPFTISETDTTKKVMTELVMREYDYANTLREIYNTTLKLIDYTTTPPIV